jgi:hypothetical protein
MPQLSFQIPARPMMTQRLAGAGVRTRKETDASTRAARCDSVLLRTCKATMAGLIRCVLCRCLGTHCTAFAWPILAQSPLPHVIVQSIVLALVSCVLLFLHIEEWCCVAVDASTCLPLGPLPPTDGCADCPWGKAQWGASLTLREAA